MTQQVEMLLDCVKMMQEGGKYSPSVAFERLVEWIAMQAQVPSGMPDGGITTPTVTLATADMLDRTLDLVLLKMVVGDHLRDAAVSLGCLAPAGWLLVEIPSTEENTRPCVFDPRAGSGTNIVNDFRQNGAEYLYYGATTNLLEYRMALVTLHLFGIKSLMFKGDPTILNLDLSSPNWVYANQWYPASDRNLERIPATI